MAANREIGIYYLHGIPIACVRQYLRVSPFPDFRQIPAGEDVAIFRSTFSGGTHLAGTRVVEIAFELRTIREGTAAAVTYRVARAARASQIRVLFMFGGLVFVSCVLSLVMPLGFVAAALSVAGIWWAGHDMLRWNGRMRDKLDAVLEQCARALGGFSVHVPSPKGGWFAIAVLGAIILPLLALVPQLMSTAACLWVLPLLVVLSLWLVMLASKLSRGTMWRASLIASPRILLVGGIGSLLFLPGMFPRTVGTSPGATLFGFVLVLLFFGLSVFPGMRRVAKVAMVWSAYGLDATRPNAPRNSAGMVIFAKSVYALGVAILADCVYFGCFVATLALGGVEQLGPAYLNMSAAVAVLPAIALLAVNQIAATFVMHRTSVVHPEGFVPTYLAVHRKFLERGWLSDEDIELSGPLPSVGVTGPAVICESSLQNRWLMVIPPWFAELSHEHKSALIAHELAHISCQGLKHRILRAMGVLLCVGVGGLLPLADLDTEEDEADNRALEYLADRGLPSNTLKRAVLALGCRRIVSRSSKELEAEFARRALSWALLLNGNLPVNATAKYSHRYARVNSEGDGETWKEPRHASCADGPVAAPMGSVQQRPCGAPEVAGVVASTQDSLRETKASAVCSMQLILTHSPLARLGFLFFNRPVIRIDNVEYRPFWGPSLIHTTPGKHVVRIRVARVKPRNYAELNLPPGGTVLLRYDVMGNCEAKLSVQEVDRLVVVDPSSRLFMAAKQVLLLAAISTVFIMSVLGSLLQLPETSLQSIGSPLFIGIMTLLTGLGYHGMKQQEQGPLRPFRPSSSNSSAP